MTQNRSFLLKIADVPIVVGCPNTDIKQRFRDGYDSFTFATHQTRLIPDIKITFHHGGLPATDNLQQIFKSDLSWNMFCDGDERFVAFQRGSSLRESYLVTHIGSDRRMIHAYQSQSHLKWLSRNPLALNPPIFPMDQIVFMYYSSARRGAIIHAAGLGVNGRGYLFPGRSGAGKTTISRLLGCQPSIEMFSDDRIIVRDHENVLTIYGTPWPGDAGIAVNKGMPLAGIFFISHGAENCIRPLNPRNVLERFLPVASIPWFDRDIIPHALSFIEDVSSAVPAYEFQCKPHDSAVDMFLRFVSDS